MKHIYVTEHGHAVLKLMINLSRLFPFFALVFTPLTNIPIGQLAQLYFVVGTLMPGPKAPACGAACGAGAPLATPTTANAAAAAAACWGRPWVQGRKQGLNLCKVILGLAKEGA